MKEPLKKLWRVVIVIIVVVVVVALASIPFIVNYAYLVGRNLSESNTVFSASDMIGLYGSLLSFLGTVALGALAMYQNHIIQKGNEEYNNTILNMQQKLNSIEFNFKFRSFRGTYGNIELEITNLSHNVAKKIHMENFFNQRKQQ